MKKLTILVMLLSSIIMVKAQCVADFTYSNSGNTYSFTNTSSGNIYNYWNFGDGGSSNAVNPTYTYVYNGTYLACLDISDNMQTCMQRKCDTIVIVNGQNPPPTCTANFSFIVYSDSVIFTNTSTGYSNLRYSSWDFGDGGSSNSTNPYNVYSSSGTYKVCLVQYDSITNCTDSICKYVSVQGQNQNCNAHFSSSISGSTVTFTNNSTNNAYNNWSFGDGNSSSAINPTHNFIYNGTYYVCLNIFTANQSCIDRYCDTIVITGGQNLPNCNADFTHRIYGDSVVFTNTSTGFSNLNYSSWSFGDGSYSSSTNPTHVYGSNGTYVVCLIQYDSVSNCTDTMCKSLVINTGSPCSAMFTLQYDSSTQSYHLVNTSNAPATATYTWNWGDGSSSTGRSGSHTYANAGQYNICLVIQDPNSNCVDTFCRWISVPSSQTSVYYNSTTSIGSSTSIDLDIRLYPNPVSHSLTLEINKGLVDGRIIIYNVVGQHQKVFDFNGEKRNIDLSEFSNGIYVLEVVDGDKILSRQKVIKN